MTSANSINNSSINGTPVNGNTNIEKKGVSNNKETTQPSLWSLIRDDLRHNHILIILSVLGSFLSCPVAYLYYFTSIWGTHDIMRNLTTSASDEIISLMVVQHVMGYLKTGHFFLQLLVLIPGAILVAFVGFRYLFNRRMVDLYHSMPVTRNRQFVAQYLTGFLIWFVPFFAGSLIILAAGCVRCMRTTLPAYTWDYTKRWIGITLLLMLCFFIIYHLALVAVMLSGNVFNAIANLLLLGLFVGAVYVLRTLSMDRFFNTFVEMMNTRLYSAIICLSPLVSPVILYYGIVQSTLFTQWGGLLWGSAALCLFNLGFAVYLHKKRSSEAAEGGMESPLFGNIFRIAISLICGYTMALLFSYLNSSTNGQQTPWILFGGIFGTGISFCVMNVIYHASFKEVFAHKLQMALTALCVCAVIMVCRYDVFSYDSYLPVENEIKGFWVASNNGLLNDSGFSWVWAENAVGTGNSERPTSAYIYDSGEKILLDKRNSLSSDPVLIREALVALNDTTQKYNSPLSGTSREFSQSLKVRVDTTHGSYYRIYNADSESFKVLEPMLSSDTYRDTYYPVSTGQFPVPDRILINAPDGAAVALNDRERLRLLYDAYAQDFKEHYSSWNHYYHSYGSDFYTLLLGYADPNQTIGGQQGYQHYHLDMWDDFARTTALLQEWYPEHAWTQEALPVTSLNISLSLYEDTPEEYLGVTDTGRTAYELQIPQYYGSNDYRNYSLTVTDPDKLAALRPYLKFTSGGWYYDAEHVYLGYADCVIRNDSEKLTTESTHRCYIELGKMPADILEEIKAGLEKTDDREYYYDDGYYDDGYYGNGYYGDGNVYYDYRNDY